jgi:hypothetical protein
MVNYNNGKIYKIEPICDHDEGDIYFGSTTKHYLSQRFDTHRSNYKRWKNNKCNKVQVFEVFDKYGVSNCQIVLIETVNVETNDELLAREKHYIKSVKCVNKNIPGQTQKEYYLDNKEEINLYAKKYREENLEKLKEKTVCPCGGSYSHFNKSHHIKTIKHQNYLKSQKDV